MTRFLRLNSHDMQLRLGSLDGGSAMKLRINFANFIRTNDSHKASVKTTETIVSPFVCRKQNPNNKDCPISQTVVLPESHKTDGNDPIIAV